MLSPQENRRNEEELGPGSAAGHHLKRLASRSEFAYTNRAERSMGLRSRSHYEEGVLVRGATRGDGRVGEEVTPGHLRTIGSIRCGFERAPGADRSEGGDYLPIRLQSPQRTPGRSRGPALRQVHASAAGSIRQSSRRGPRNGALQLDLRDRAVRGLDLATPMDEVGGWTRRLQGPPSEPSTTGRRERRRALPLVGGAARVARLRDRRA